MKLLGCIALLVVMTSAVITSSDAFAWGASAYRLVSQSAAQSLPLEIPEFLRTAEAGRQIAEVSRQPDWSKGAGEPHDADSGPANFVLVGDDLRIARGPLLSALPSNRAAYDAALRKAGSDQYKAGFLPYALIDGWQQLVVDLAYWRADAAGAKWARAPAERSYFLKDQYIREGMTIRDLGYLSHLVANGSQPMNVSIHAAKDLRARFEGMVVRSRIGDKDIIAQMPIYRDCRCSIQRRISDYLGASHNEAINLYTIEKSDGFGAASDTGRGFVVKRLAAAASELRDLITDAWRRSSEMSVGAPAIAIRDIESGKTDAYDSLRGTD